MILPAGWNEESFYFKETIFTDMDKGNRLQREFKRWMLF
jgi:hypothetical protein